MNTQLSFTHLILNASLLVQLVMGFLLLLSVISWTIIFQRSRQYKQSRNGADDFEDKFWSGIDLNNLYQDCIKRQDSLQGLELIYTAGFKEFVRLVNSGPADQEVVMDGTYRQMKVACSREIEALETHLPTLATIGSISPYIGLFGTVWGIMHAFISLAAVQNATLAMVAPPIAEALIATAMGLFAAIPAVMFYNRFANKLEAFENRYLNFMDEFATILNRRLVTIRALPQTYQGQQQPRQGQPKERAQAQAAPQNYADPNRAVPIGGTVPPRTASDKRNEAHARLPEADEREVRAAQDRIFGKGASSEQGRAQTAQPRPAPQPAPQAQAPQTQMQQPQERPQYVAGAVKNIGAGAQAAPAQSSEGPVYKYGPDPKRFPPQPQESGEVHYKIGLTPEQSEAVAKAKARLESEPVVYKVGPTPEQLEQQALNQSRSVRYQIGPKVRPQPQADSGPVHYVTPGVQRPAEQDPRRS